MTPRTPTDRPSVAFVVLAKAPVPGQVKTRLTTAYSEHEAAALAAAALLDSLDAVRAAAALAPGTERRLVCALSGDLDQAAAPEALRAGLVGFDVLAAARQRARLPGSRPPTPTPPRDGVGATAGATVQIGMDTPQADPAVLAAAAADVSVPDGPDAVLGLAADGGWWLLALRRPADARLVAEVPMSTPETGRLTRRALEDAGLRVAAAPVLSDVDEPDDVVRVARRCPDSRFAALAGVLGGRPAVAS